MFLYYIYIKDYSTSNLYYLYSSTKYQYDGNGNRTSKIGTQGITARNSALQSATIGNITEESNALALHPAVMGNITEGSSALQPSVMDIRYQYDIRG